MDSILKLPHLNQSSVEADYKYAEEKEQANVTTETWNVFVLLWSLLKTGYMDVGGIITAMDGVPKIRWCNKEKGNCKAYQTSLQALVLNIIRESHCWYHTSLQAY